MAGLPIWYELMTPEPGGHSTHDIHEVPGGDFIFTATDPAGAPVGFVGPKGV